MPKPCIVHQVAHVEPSPDTGVSRAAPRVAALPSMQSPDSPFCALQNKGQRSSSTPRNAMAAPGDFDSAPPPTSRAGAGTLKAQKLPAAPLTHAANRHERSDHSASPHTSLQSLLLGSQQTRPRHKLRRAATPTLPNRPDTAAQQPGKHGSSPAPSMSASVISKDWLEEDIFGLA